jgi:hypothetical protein
VFVYINDRGKKTSNSSTSANKAQAVTVFLNPGTYTAAVKVVKIVNSVAVADAGQFTISIAPK